MLILPIGMITSWNKLCFTTGYIEVSISLPGAPKVPGLWPGKLLSINKVSISQLISGAWTLGNLVSCNFVLQLTPSRKDLGQSWLRGVYRRNVAIFL